MIERILKLMAEKEINARKLTTEIGLHASAITDWRQGKAKPSTDAIIKIADYFDVSTDYLLGRSNIPSHYAKERPINYGYMDIFPEVWEALEAKWPVVALESTIIFHGMPYPQNIECHNRCEEIIRSRGAVPAAIAVHKGRIKVGLTSRDIDEMLNSGDVAKLSRRDLAHVVASGRNGATTVAATMMVAEMAGVAVFATGGIGGVHRGAQTTFDISADLQQLAQSNVCVVCAGAKSILDIGLTLEYLETLGVPVLGYKTDDFPAFYMRRSGYKADYAMSGAAEIARMLKAKWGMGIRGGVLVGNPVPEEYAMDEAVISRAIDQALAEAEAKGIFGKETTPFLLSKVAEVTGGASLETNMRLVWNNCEKAADIAKEYCS